jgi:hypothetical protein
MYVLVFECGLSVPARMCALALDAFGGERCLDQYMTRRLREFPVLYVRTRSCVRGSGSVARGFSRYTHYARLFTRRLRHASARRVLALLTSDSGSW